MGDSGSTRRSGPAQAASGRLQCPFCNSYDVARLFVASLGIDSCACAACSAHWDEERSSGRYRGRSESASILVRTPS